MSGTHSPPVGIDLGTTHSLVAVVQAGRPVVLPNALGELLTPSAVAVDARGTLLVGAAARERLTVAPTAGAAFFKREMGEGTRFAVGDQSLGAVELSALVLRSLKEAAEAHLGVAVERAVVSVPAYFHEPQRAATREAARLAGLEVLRLINEPTAAAIAYGLHDTRRERVCAVLDLGGGTFDVTLLEVFDGVVEIVASGGDSRLGGEDFTDALTDWAAREAGGTALSETSRAMLRSQCERVKRRLTDTAEVDLPLPRPAAERWEIAREVRVSRNDLERICAPLIERVGRCVQEVLGQARRAPDKIDEIILVGGATRMPWVHGLSRRIFGRDPVVGAEPDLDVARGAAVQAALVTHDASVRDLVVTDVTPHSLGVEVVRDAGDRLLPGYFLPVLHRNTTLPARRVTRVSTLHPGQRQITVRVYQGDRRFTAQNRFLGAFEVTDLPALEGTEGGQPVDLGLSCDVNGLLEVEATVVATGRKASIVIDQHPGQLSPEEREGALRALQSLKTHPRELLPNRHLLERAYAEFEFLDPRGRAQLEPFLFAFEAALERQAPDEVRPAAELLRRVLAQVGGTRG